MSMTFKHEPCSPYGNEPLNNFESEIVFPGLHRVFEDGGR